MPLAAVDGSYQGPRFVARRRIVTVDDHHRPPGEQPKLSDFQHGQNCENGQSG